MSSGVTILSARYGVGTTTVDVQSAVSAKTKDGKVNFVVSPSALNVDDPAVGQIKTLTVEYSINGGKSNTDTVKDGDYLKIDAPPERVASGLQIVKAEYGYEGNFADVTDAIQNYISNGSIAITVSPSTVGIPDPNPAKPKLLKVDVTINGAASSYSIPDGKKFNLSAPALDDSHVIPIGKQAESVSTILFNSIWTVLRYSIHFSITILAAKYGERKFGSAGKWGLGILSLITYGIFPIFVLPIIVFWWRLFSSSDVYY
jgi:hypothetical protein